LINPAHVKKQIVCVFSTTWLKPIATVLANLGSERALVVSSQDGLDEISIAAPTEVIEYKNGAFHHWIINPEEYGIKYHSLNDIIVDSPMQSLKLIQSVFSKKPGAARDMVLLNSAAALYCATENLSYTKALEQAKSALDSGKAAQCFNRLRLLTQNLNKEAHHE